MKSKLLLGAVIAATFYTLPASAAYDVDVIVKSAPPPPRTEKRVHARPGYVHIPGYWDYRGRQYVWVPTRVERERPGYYWRDTRWIEQDGRYVLVRGSWRRDRDRDNDGIPNRFDSLPNDRDNDGIPDPRDRYPDNPRRS